jgi:hypothetical protein
MCFLLTLVCPLLAAELFICQLNSLCNRSWKEAHCMVGFEVGSGYLDRWVTQLIRFCHGLGNFFTETFQMLWKGLENGW